MNFAIHIELGIVVHIIEASNVSIGNSIDCGHLAKEMSGSPDVGLTEFSRDFLETTPIISGATPSKAITFS